MIVSVYCELYISRYRRNGEHTVKFHVSAIYSKPGASSRTEAVGLVRLGLIVL
jgi:DNA-binding NarL/FixJ family response regulator